MYCDTTITVKVSVLPIHFHLMTVMYCDLLHGLSMKIELSLNLVAVCISINAAVALQTPSGFHCEAKEDLTVEKLRQLNSRHRIDMCLRTRDHLQLEETNLH